MVGAGGSPLAVLILECFWIKNELAHVKASGNGRPPSSHSAQELGSRSSGTATLICLLNTLHLALSRGRWRVQEGVGGDGGARYFFFWFWRPHN